MRKFIVSMMLLLGLIAIGPAIAQDNAGTGGGGGGVNIERHVEYQTTAPSTGGWSVDNQTLMWVGGLIGVVVLMGLVAMASRGGESVTVVRE